VKKKCEERIFGASMAALESGVKNKGSTLKTRVKSTEIKDERGDWDEMFTLARLFISNILAARDKLDLDPLIVISHSENEISVNTVLAHLSVFVGI